MVNPYSSPAPSPPPSPRNWWRICLYSFAGVLMFAVLACYLVVLYEPETQAAIKAMEEPWPLRLIHKFLAWVV